MITATGRDVCHSALRLLGVIGDGIPMSAEQLSESFSTLNSFIDSLGTQPQSMYTITRSVTTCAPAASYTIGPGGLFNVARPEPFQITGAAFIVPGTAGTTTEELPIPVITDDMYRLNQMKAQTNTQPTMLYYNPTNTGAGLGTLILWPILTQSVDLVLYIQQYLSQFTNTTSPVVLVTGLHRMLVANLAKELLPLYGQTNPIVAQSVIERAGMSLADYKRANARMSDLSSDALFTGNRRYGYNINTGTGG